MGCRELFSCEGKVAVVTGGGGLVGRAIAAALKEFGAKVYIADIDESAGGVAADIGAEHLKLDITSEASVSEALGAVVKDSGGLDVLINSAYPRTKDWHVGVAEVPFDSWKKNVDDHLGGYFLCCRGAAEQMRRCGGGSIINLASIYGVVAPDFSIYEGTQMTMPAAYSAIKGGVISFTRYIATYYAMHKVRANSISPGGVFDGQDPSFVERYCAKTPLGRMADPDDIACAALFLASNGSSYITGQNLVVDGGWTAW